MKLTARSRYGTLIVLDIAQFGQDAPVRSCDIAQRKNISMKYMEKITGDLRKGGILSSRRGPGGGHLLSKSPEMIAVGDVVRVLDRYGPFEHCMGDPEHCDRSDSCLFHRLWLEAEKALLDNLNKVTFADLVKDRRLCPAAKTLLGLDWS